MIVFDNVSKIYCIDINNSRKNAISRIMGLKRRNHFLEDNEFYAIKDISFALEKGKSLIIVGPPSANTAIARLICGLTNPSGGSVKVAGRTRLVGSSKVGTTPFMSVRNYLYLLSMLYGLDRRKLRETCDKILQDCGMKHLAEKKIGELTEDLVKRVSYYTSIFIDSDVYVFDKLKFESSDYGGLCKKRFEEILNTRTVVILGKTIKELPINSDNVMFIDGSRKLYFGPYESAIEIHNRSEELETDKEIHGEDISASISSVLSNYKKMTQREAERDTCSQDYHINALEISIKKIVEDKLDRLLKEQKPVIAGPYISDVGIELIYWIPFLRWLIETYRLDGNTFIAVSRCGVDKWYKELGVRYVDICDLLGQENAALLFKERVAAGSIKQFTMTKLESSLINTVSEKNGFVDYHLIHPSVMYNLFLPVWKHLLPEGFICNYTSNKPFKSLKGGIKIDGLPDEYVAVKFSFCPQFPDNPQNRFFLESIIDELSRQYQVVNLNTGIQIDGHRDFGTESKGIFDLKNIVNHRNLLEVQTNVIANAKLFIGTHTNMAYLAPLIGIKTINIYSEMNAGIYPVNAWILNSLPANFLNHYFSVVEASPLNLSDLINETRCIMEGEK